MKPENTENTENTELNRPANDPKKLLGALGLAARAGKIVFGTQNVCDALKEGRVLLVIEASDNSENTRKRLSDRCAYYGVRRLTAPVTAVDLGYAIGRRTDVSSAAVTDPNFAVLITRGAEAAGCLAGTQNEPRNERDNLSK